MLRGGDQDSVNAWVVQHPPEILVSLDAGNSGFHGLQAPRVNIGHGGAFHIGTAQGSSKNLLATAARADQPEAHPLVGAQDTARRNQPGPHYGGGALQRSTQKGTTVQPGLFPLCC